MSRSTQLLVGILLVLSGIAAVVAGVLVGQDDSFAVFMIVAGVMALSGFALVAHAALAGLPAEVAGRVAMSFSWATLGTGLVVAVGSVAAVAAVVVVTGILTKQACLIPAVGVPIGLLIAARAWSPECVRCARRLDELGQFHLLQKGDRQQAARAFETRDPLLLARVLGAAKQNVPLNEATASPIVLESCRGCSSVAMARLGGSSAWFLDASCGVVLGAAGARTPRLR